jgi:hypothetical protein
VVDHNPAHHNGGKSHYVGSAVKPHRNGAPRNSQESLMHEVARLEKMSKGLAAQN